MTKAETKTLLQLLEEVPDHRVGNAIKYSLRDILFLGMFAILCGAETYTGMQVFGELHLEELRQYQEQKTVLRTENNSVNQSPVIVEM